MALSPDEAVDRLQCAQEAVRRLAWGLALHLPNGIGGGAGTVEREGENVNAWLDQVIGTIRAQDCELQKAKA